MAATTKLITTAGPATSCAARPVSVKMPAPMTTPTPKTVRSSADNDLRSRNSGSSVSAIDAAQADQAVAAVLILAAVPFTLKR